MEAKNSPSSTAKRLKLCNEQTMENNCGKEEEERDYISNLSNTLLHHILSFLDMKYAVPTCVLSKRWRYLWNSLPTLRFNNNLFSPSSRTSWDDGFEDFVNNVLILRDNSNIKRFHFKGYGDAMRDDPFNKWILYALRRNVEELYFDIKFNEIQFVNCLFTCNSLTKLIVEIGDSYDRKQIEIILPDSIDLPHLKTMHLDSILFVNENLTNKLFSSCPSLESLSITKGEFRQMNVNISSLKLKYLRVENNCKNFCKYRSLESKFKLDTPNLTSFICKDYMSKDYILENVSSVVKADINMKADVGESLWAYKQLPVERQQMYAQRMIALSESAS